jgi:hypothetical protein
MKSPTVPVRRPKRSKIPVVKKESKLYFQLWKVLDGAFNNCMKNHPEYFSDKISNRTIRESINKRGVGAVYGFLRQREKIQP